MIVTIAVEGRLTPFRLVPLHGAWNAIAGPEHGRWHSLVEHQESDFPLITAVNGTRYELFSDGTFAKADLAKERNQRPPDAGVPVAAP